MHLDSEGKVVWVEPMPQPIPHPRSERVFSSPLDPGIERAVHLLMDNGVETYESCQGGEGHASPYPVVSFHGQQYEGFRALSVAMSYGLPVFALHRVWSVQDGEPTGPSWQLEFRTQLPPLGDQVQVKRAALGTQDAALGKEEVAGC